MVNDKLSCHHTNHKNQIPVCFNTACYLAMFLFVSLHYTSQRTKIMFGLFSLSVVLWVLSKVLICFSHFSFQCSPSLSHIDSPFGAFYKFDARINS